MITVYICTHNPKKDIFAEVLEGLRIQDLKEADYEVLLIDNASSFDLQEEFDFSGLPRFRFISEPKVGKVNAMLTAYKYAQGELLIMVDDDNILSQNYLSTAWRIHRERPELGAFGGSNIARYLQKPEPWFSPFEGMIAVRRVGKDHSSSDPHDYSASPVGAGLVFTADVARRFVEQVSSEPRWGSLDRQGGKLMGGADIYVSLCACELGLHRGNCKDLSLIHVIPGNRVTMKYLIPLAEGAGYSNIVMKYIISQDAESFFRAQKLTLRQRLGRLRSTLFKEKHFRAVKAALRKGECDALVDIRSGKFG